MLDGRIEQSEILESPSATQGGDFSIALENATLRFVADRDGRGEGLGGIDLVSTDRAAALTAARERGVLGAVPSACDVPGAGDVLALCGMRVRLV